MAHACRGSRHPEGLACEDDGSRETATRWLLPPCRVSSRREGADRCISMTLVPGIFGHLVGCADEALQGTCNLLGLLTVATITQSKNRHRLGVYSESLYRHQTT